MAQGSISGKVNLSGQLRGTGSQPPVQLKEEQSRLKKSTFRKEGKSFDGAEMTTSWKRTKRR